MSTATAEDVKRDEKKKAQQKDRKEDKKKHPRDPAREVVETVVFVVVLVLLLKLFVTEAFVIPTGSMAETLYGYQKIVTCAKCGHSFPVNAHDEVEVNQQTKQKHPLVGYVCPNCRYLGKIEDLNPRPQANSGDRVLVLKPLYHIRSPQRGDVVVFKYPEAPQENQIAANYIKRAMGFGGETVAIHRGKLYVTRALTYPEGDPQFPRPENPLDLWKKEFMYENNKQAEDLFEASRLAGFTDRVPGGFQAVRKEEPQLLADLRVVWDNDKQPRDLAGAVPPRWEVYGPGRWNPDNPQQPRAFTHTGDQLEWLRYQHLVWKKGHDGRVPWRWPDKDDAKPLAGPVDNMLGYNAGLDYNPITNEVQSRDTPREASMWVGDLCLECEAELAGGAEVALELSKGVNRFRATFGNGQVTLSRIGPKDSEFGTPSRPCRVTAGVHKLRFANIDCRLWVWVDGKRIDFGAEGDYIPVETTTYDPEDSNTLTIHKEGWVRANDIDEPAKIGAKGQVSVRGIKLFRDIYYTRGGLDQTGADIFYVQPGHYLCLGDNSAQSSDSRRWGAVPERLMLGKAVFVFFPVTFNKATNRAGFIK
jgi:signal peptidase I